MTWLGLSCDEGPYQQSQRHDRYQEQIQFLLDQGMAYRCTCSKERLTPCVRHKWHVEKSLAMMVIVVI